MAKMATASKMPKDDDEEEEADGASTEAEGGEGEGDDEEGEEEEKGEVLLTVMKEEDGTYRLIEGDEDEEEEGEEGEGEEGGAMAGGEEEEGKTYDSKGALLKAILDILNEDEASEGEPGSSGDQFQAGFDQNKPAAPMPQKY